MSDVAALFHLLSEKGAARYGGELVSQLQHALQCAALAERAIASESLVTAALLHDIGHLLLDDEGLAAAGEDAQHEVAGAAALARCFGPAVTEPVRLHVAAKRYLCATNARYRSRLSPASATSLQLQGGICSPAEVAQFEQHTFSRAAIAVRSWDDNAKNPEAETPGLGHFQAIAERLSRGWRHGRLILVVGPSGVGKDSLIAAARQRLADDPRYDFPQRLVTRPCDPLRELHDSVSEADFEAMTQSGRLCLAWTAHGLSYGLPLAVAEALAAGRTVVVNTSRGVVGAACDRFRNVEVIHVTARPDTIAARLGARDAMAGPDRKARLERRVALPEGRAPVTAISNDGAFAQSLTAFLDAVTRGREER